MLSKMLATTHTRELTVQAQQAAADAQQQRSVAEAAVQESAARLEDAQAATAAAHAAVDAAAREKQVRGVAIRPRQAKKGGTIILFAIYYTIACCVYICFFRVFKYIST